MVDSLGGLQLSPRWDTELNNLSEYRTKRRVRERFSGLDGKDSSSLTATPTLQGRDGTTIPPPTTFTHIASGTEASDSSTSDSSTSNSSTSNSDVATTTIPTSQSTDTGTRTTSSTPSQGVGGAVPTGISTSSTTSTAQSITATQTSGMSTSKNKKDVPVIVATVIGAIALLSILILALVFLRRHLKRRKRWRRPSNVPSIETVSPFTLASSSTSPLATDNLSVYTMAQLPSPRSYRSQLERKLKNEGGGERAASGGRDNDRRGYDYDGDGQMWGIRREPASGAASNASVFGVPPPSYQP